MRFGRHRARGTGLLLAVIATLSLPTPTAAAPSAAITAEFGDSCRDFEAHSTKDISHVVIHYADDRVVKDESITTPDYSIDGVSDEIDAVDVKSARTLETFACTRVNSPPTAVLERKAGSFDPDDAPGTWTGDDCIWPECFYSVPTAPGSAVPDERTVGFRGISSTDPGEDIVSWSIDFGDGTTPAGGSWATEPPVEVVHHYAAATSRTYTATLTVTDSAGQSSSDAMAVSMSLFDTND